MSSITVKEGIDNIYVNVLFRQDASSGVEPTIARYDVTKTNPIVNNVSEYYLSVIRFDIPLNAVPIFIFPVTPGSPAGATQPSPCIIGIRTGGVNFPTNLIYVPDQSVYPLVAQTDPNDMIITPAYFCYSYTKMLTAINTALATSYTAAGAPGGAGAPYFYWDADSELVNLVVPNAFTAAGATIYFNEELMQFLDGWQTFFFGYNQAGGRDYEFILGTTDNYTAPNPPFPANTRLYPQDYNTTVFWQAVRKITIGTSGIPIVGEQVPIYTSGGGQESGQTSIFPIVSDFVLNIENAKDARSVAYYNPPGQYRLADMKGQRDLRSLDFSLFWEDREGRLFPLTLSTGQSASLKVLIAKKSLYKGTNNNLLIK